MAIEERMDRTLAGKKSRESPLSSVSPRLVDAGHRSSRVPSSSPQASSKAQITPTQAALGAPGQPGTR